jgi:hypothetical protein
MLRAIKVISVCIIGIAGSFQCTLLPSIAGNSSSETTNGYVVGSLVNTDGSPAMYTRVKLIPGNYDPVKDGPVPDSMTGTTDESGVFCLRVAHGGKFNIEAYQPGSGERALLTGITANQNDTDYLPVQEINKTGAIKLVSMAGKDGYIYIPGTSRFAPIKDAKSLIDSVPAGFISSIVYTGFEELAKDSVVAADFSVSAGDTTVVSNASVWKFSKQCRLNTTLSGADVLGTVTNFPILIRLSAADFDFSQALADGGDLRFMKDGGMPLPFEIERWDPAAQRAEIWVKVDTIYGNDSTHYITMLWGDSSATGSSNGAAVFDTANGFAAVWHLNTDCSDITTGKHDGTNFGATDTVGIIGGAKKFNGSSYIQVPGLLGEPQSITLSAWVHLDSTIIFSQDIVSLGDAVALRADRVVAPSGTEGFFCSKMSASDTVFVFTNTEAFISKTGWRYLTYTVDGARHVQSMYIDGIFQCSTNDTNPINYSELGPNTFLGTHGNKKTASYAFGCIDEARVCRVARSVDWIKLCYMNQKQQDALVRW